MNLSIITGQIITQPQIINIKKKNIIYMSVKIPSEKKDITFHNIYIYIQTYSYDKFCELYQMKDIVILKGNLYVRQHSKHLLKYNPYIIMKVEDIQPYIGYVK